MSLGEKIAFLRKRAGYSRTAFALKIGIPHTTLRNYETGVREPGHLFLIQIAREFGVTTDFLLGLSNSFEDQILFAPENSKLEKNSKRLKLIENFDAMNEAGQDELLKHSRLLLMDNQYLACAQFGEGAEIA